MTQNTPWTVTHSSWEYSLIYDAENNLVARVDINSEVTEETQDEYEAEKNATAESIVKACNHHAALVEALREMLKHSGVDDMDPRDKFPEDIAAESKARTLLTTIEETK